MTPYAQPPLWDDLRKEAQKATDAAIERVDAAAVPDWKEEAAVVIRRVCEQRRYLTPDDVWLNGLSKPREPRAFGPAMMRAVKAGWCRPTGEFRCSVIPSQHRNPIRVYESLIYGATPAARHGSSGGLGTPSSERSP